MAKKRNSRKKSKSPRIYRYIPADRIAFFKVYRGTLKVFIAILFILAIIFVWYNLTKNIEEKKKLDTQRMKLMGELKFWEKFLEKNKGYRDAYFQASILEYKLGDSEKAKKYVREGLTLDPNSENGKNIQEFLEEN